MNLNGLRHGFPINVRRKFGAGLPTPPNPATAGLFVDLFSVDRASPDPGETLDRRSPILPLRFRLLLWTVCLFANRTILHAEETAPPIKPTTIIVVGAGGAPQFDAAFADWADRWLAAATKAGHEVIVIGRASEEVNQTDRQRLQSTLENAAKVPAVDLWLVMIGHGTFNQREAKFNLRGPDFSAQELSGWLKSVDRPMAIVNTASASAPFLAALASPKRVVIVATKSGSEQNFARFGDFMSQAIVDPIADLDKDDQTSLWEAFLLASRRTAEFYSTDGRLQTEHPLLDDTGDGQGVRSDQFRGLTPLEKTLDGKPLDGQRAHQWHLLRNPADAALPLEILRKRDDLELSILQLRDRKATLPKDAYLQELERLLIELAELNESAGR